MTVAGVAATNKNTVRTIIECFENKSRFNPARAHYPQGSDISLIFHPGGACQVCSGVGAPFAQKSYNPGFEFHMYFHFNKIQSVIDTSQINLPKNDKDQNDQYYTRLYCEKNHNKIKILIKSFY